MEVTKLEYMKKSDVVKETGITLGRCQHLIYYKYFKDYYKSDSGIWFISQSDVDMLKADLEYVKKSYSVNELIDILCCSKIIVLQIIKVLFSNSFKFFFDKYFVDKDAVDKYISEHPEINLIRSGELILISDLSEQNKVQLKNIYNFVKRNKEYPYIQHPLMRRFYVSKECAARITETYDFIDNSYTFKDLANLINCEYDYLNQYRKEINALFPSNRRISKQYRYEKNQIDSMLAKFKPYERTVQNILLEYYKQYPKPINEEKKAKSTKQIRKVNYNNLFIDGKTYLTTMNAAKELNIENETVIRSINRKKFTDIIKSGSQYWIYDNEIKSIKIKYYESIEFNSIPEDIMPQNRKLVIMNKKAIKQYFPNAFQFDTFGIKVWRIPLSDIDEFVLKHLEEENRQQLILQEKDPRKLYELFLQPYNNTPYKDTLYTYNEFFISQINKTNVKNLRHYTFKHSSTLIRLLENINKEIYLYTDNELKDFFTKSYFNSTHKSNVGIFLKFCRNKFKHKCLFTNDYNRYNNQISHTIDDKIYSQEKWMSYFSFLTDVNAHIVNAFNNYKYSKMWLFTILHLSIAWRRSDIYSMPALNIENIDKYILKWFEENTYTLFDAQNIINSIKDILSLERVNKTGVRNHFIIYPVLIIPTSIAFIIAEYHRKANNQENLFGKSKFDKSDFIRFFKDKSLADFSNIKANRTLITYNFENAATTNGMCDLAYSLSTYLRAHKIGKTDEIASTTAQYIYSTNSDGDVNNIALNLFKRGHFGWLYYSLLSIAGFNESATQEDITNSIIRIKNEFSPIAIESMAKCLEYEYEERKEVVGVLLRTPKCDIKRILFSLSRGEMPSKINYTQCLKHSNCPYPLNTNCIGCKYKIPTNYTLAIVNSQLESLIQQMKNLDDTDYDMRKKYTFQIIKLLSVINEAKHEFDKWDKNYIGSFINLDKLEQEIELLFKSKFMLYEEV